MALTIAAFLVVYLGVVWIWAVLSVDELLSESSDSVVELSPRQTEILIKVEDPTFYKHRGLDLSDGQGLTTITSSIAVSVFLRGKQLNGIKGAMQRFYRGVFSCCKRIDIGRDLMALVLDSHTSKEKQINLFINGAYFGSVDSQSIVGFNTAADAYYGTRLSQLSKIEFTGLVAMLLAPNHYHPMENPEVHAH